MKKSAIQKIIDAAKSVSEENGEHKVAFKMLCLILNSVEITATLKEKEQFYKLLGSLPEKMNERKRLSEVLEKEK